MLDADERTELDVLCTLDELAGGGVALLDELVVESEDLVAVLSDPQAARPVIARAAIVILRVRFMFRPLHRGCADDQAGLDVAPAVVVPVRQGDPRRRGRPYNACSASAVGSRAS